MSDPQGLFVTAKDGLRLHVAQWGEVRIDAHTVVCLPGLTRTGEDFAVLAQALTTDAAWPRRVLALDCRGRGRSNYDRNPYNYSLAVELGDVLAVLESLRVSRATFIGTSRGGILTMLLATIRQDLITGAVLNDIGPVIELPGLLRIKSYVGKMPAPRDFAHASEILRTAFADQFPKLADADWLAWAHRSYRERDGALSPTYDPLLSETMAGVKPGSPPADLWDAFAALAEKPVLVVRGALSNLLSEATVTEIQARFPAVEALTVPDQGHAPLLAEPDTLDAVARFVRRCEERSAPSATC